MICVYDRLATTFEGHGLGVLHPTKCEITEEAGGSYDLTMEHPFTESGKALLLERGCVIRAPGAPKKDAAREQLFRVIRVTRSDDDSGVTVQARHISYDLMYNSVGSVVHEEKVPASQVAAELMAALEDQGHGFRLLADGLTAPVAGSWTMCNGVNALLDQEAGLVRMARARLIRDNHVIRLLPEGAPDSGVVIRYGRNMTGLQLEEDEEGVYTRLIPVGENADGTELFLPERQIDSPRLLDYPRPRVSMWKVSGAKVGGKAAGSEAKLTEEDVWGLLRDAAQEKFDAFVDEPKRQVQAGYIDLGSTEEYAEYGALQTVSLYDLVGIRHDPQGISLQIAVCGYTWDVLAGRYTQLKLGDVYADKTANVIVTAPQLAQQRRSTNRQLIAANGRLDIVADEIYLQGEHIKLLATKEEVTAQGSRLSRVEIDLDAANARIDLKAERTEVLKDMETIRSEVNISLDAANSRIDLCAKRTELEDGMEKISSEVSVSLDAVNSRIDLEAQRRNELAGEVSTAKVTIDALNASIKLKADKTVTDALGTRMSAAEVDIDGVQASIALKASQQSVDALGKRVTSAEATLTVQAGEILAKVSAGDIASAINQTAQSVKIQASKIELSGYVTASQLSATNAAFDNLVSGATAAASLKTNIFSASTGFTYQNHSVSYQTISIDGTTYHLMGYR